MGFVDEQDDRFRRGLNVFDDLTQALFELAFHARARLQQADIEAAQLDILECRRHVAGHDAQRKAFDHRGFAHACFAREDRVVLSTAHEDVDHLADFLVAPDDGVELAAAGLLGHVHGEALEGFLFAHRARGHRAAGFAGCGRRVETVVGAEGVFRGVADVFVKALAQGFDLDLVELAGQVQQPMAQARRLENADQQIPRAHLAFAEHQAAVDPAALDRFLDVRRQIGDRR